MYVFLWPCTGKGVPGLKQSNSQISLQPGNETKVEDLPSFIRLFFKNMFLEGERETIYDQKV